MQAKKQEKKNQVQQDQGQCFKDRGTNGTGKTNFLNLVTTILSSNYQYLSHDMFEKRRSMCIIE